MERLKFLVVGVLGLFLMLLGFGQAVALTIDTCRTFASLDGSADDDDHLVNGVLTVNNDLTIGPTGCITCNDNPGLPSNASACPIGIDVGGNFVMEAGSKILAENQAAGGNGGDITITVGGDVTLKGIPQTTPCPSCTSPGAIISSSKTSGAGDTGHSGNITLHATGNVFQEPCSRVIAGGQPTGASGNGGVIEIKGNSITIQGLVASTGGTTVGRGGPITIDADCDLKISDCGKVSSKGQDPGADRVHLEGGCIVQIFGVVESTAPGHIASPTNHCHGGPTSDRPEKPLNANACVEVWAGDALEIDSTGTHNGEVNADTGFSGGTQGTSWIDLFARGDISINGDFVTPYTPGTLPRWAVHANQTLGNGKGGTIHVASRDGKVETSGRAIQANDTSSGGDGGKVFVEASGTDSTGAGDVNFGNASIQAMGGAGSGALGGLITVRSFNGTILGVAPGQLRACTLSNSLLGLVRLKGCLVVNYPVAQTCPTPPLIDPPGDCGGVVLFEPYVELPPCICGCVCVSSFSPKAADAGDTVTIRGTSLKSVTQVFFNPTDCDPEGTQANIASKTDTQIKITVPSVGAGQYNLVINIEGLNSICMAEKFVVQ